MVHKFFDKNSTRANISGGAVTRESWETLATRYKSVFIQNQKLAKELHKPIIRNFEKRKVHSSFIDNIWSADLADMKLLSKYNKGIHLLCVLDIYSKYAWVVHLKKGGKGITITDAFQNIVGESIRRVANSEGRKPNKIWVE